MSIECPTYSQEEMHVFYVLAACHEFHAANIKADVLAFQTTLVKRQRKQSEIKRVKWATYNLSHNALHRYQGKYAYLYHDQKSQILNNYS